MKLNLQEQGMNSIYDTIDSEESGIRNDLYFCNTFSKSSNVVLTQNNNIIQHDGAQLIASIEVHN